MFSCTNSLMCRLMQVGNLDLRECLRFNPYCNFMLRYQMLFCFSKIGILLLLFCRYVVRAKAGKKQSSKDATGKAAHSAGSALRRYNEAALKKVPITVPCRTFMWISLSLNSTEF